MSESLFYFIAGSIFTLITGLLFGMWGGKLTRFWDSWSEKRALDSRKKSRESLLIEYLMVWNLKHLSNAFLYRMAHLAFQALATLVILAVIILWNVATVNVLTQGANLPNSVKLSIGGYYYTIVIFEIVLNLISLVVLTFFAFHTSRTIQEMLVTISRVWRFEDYKKGVIERLAQLDNIPKEEIEKLLDNPNQATKDSIS